MNRRITPSNAAPKRRILTGEPLWRALNFSNERAFQRARQKKQIEIRFFPMAGTRGVFAYADDVERYITAKVVVPEPSAETERK